MKKKRLVKTKSFDGEIHFQECRAPSCATAEHYDEEEALKISKKEAAKPLLLNKKSKE